MNDVAEPKFYGRLKWFYRSEKNVHELYYVPWVDEPQLIKTVTPDFLNDILSFGYQHELANILRHDIEHLLQERSFYKIERIY